MTIVDPEFRERMYRSKIPSYARGKNPFHSRFAGLRKAIGELDPAYPVWFRMDWEIPWEEKEPLLILWGAAAKGSLMNGSNVLVHDASAIVTRVSQDWFSFINEFEGHMLFLTNFGEFREDEYDTLAKVYFHWHENRWPIWCRSHQTPEEFVTGVPKTKERVRRFAVAFKKFSQLLEASEYV